MPSDTRPKTVYCPSSAGWSVTQTKNCAPALSGLPGCSTAATAPRVAFSPFGSRLSTPRPPVPYCAFLAGSFESGSPPCTMPYLMARWNVVPSYAPSPASFMK